MCDRCALVEHTHLGLNAISHVDYALADVQLDRTMDRTGRRNYGQTPPTPQDSGTYAGFDRFGRLKRHAWVLGDSYRNSVTDRPILRELVKFSYFHDAAGNITHRRVA